MNKRNVNTWVKALRSGEYKQGDGLLCSIENDGSEAFCCLGVAIDVLCDGHWENDGEMWSFRDWRDMPNDKTLKEIGLSDHIARKLARMNDGGKSFRQIAYWIERNGHRLNEKDPNEEA